MDILKKQIAVIGSGSWGTALVKILLQNTDKVTWWIREPEIIENLINYNHNPLYLSSVEFELDQLNLTDNLKNAIEVSDIIILCIPAAFLDSTLSELPVDIFKNKIIVSAIKGIVPEKNMIIADYLQNKYDFDLNNFVVISGPSHAEEVALEKITYLTIASNNEALAFQIEKYIKCRFILTAISDDIYGTEYAPVLKNIYAIASGIANALGYGDNFQSVLVSNSIQEMERFLNAVHPINRDIKSSVYLGDLLVTTYSQFSRNRMFGNMIGKGYSVKFIQLEMKMIAEGYYAVKGINAINKNYQVVLPIIDAVYNILYLNKSPSSEFRKLTEIIR